MCSRCVAPHVTAIRVYIPSLLPSSSSSKRLSTRLETRIVLAFTPLFCCVVFVPFSLFNTYKFKTPL